VDWTKPVARFEEAIATIRALWDSGGELVSRDSPFFPLRNPCSTFRPFAGHGPKIWIGAHGRGCCEPPGATATRGCRLSQRPGEYQQRLEVVRARRLTPGVTRCSSLPRPGCL